MHSLLDKISNSGTSKPVLRFPFVSGGREGVENETNVIRFASFCELLRRPLEKNLSICIDLILSLWSETHSSVKNSNILLFVFSAEEMAGGVELQSWCGSESSLELVRSPAGIWPDVRSLLWIFFCSHHRRSLLSEKICFAFSSRCLSYSASTLWFLYSFQVLLCVLLLPHSSLSLLSFLFHPPPPTPTPVHVPQKCWLSCSHHSPKRILTKLVTMHTDALWRPSAIQTCFLLITCSSCALSRNSKASSSMM